MTESSLRFSVIIPTYNRENSVGEAIESVLAQTRPADQVIVVDDGSTDGTAKVLAGFGSAIEIISQANTGVSGARNAGCAAATGTWLTFLDSDDLWVPERLAVLERDVIAAPPEVVAHLGDLQLTGPGYSTLLFEERSIIAPKGGAAANVFALDQALAGLFTQQSAIRASAYHKAGGFDQSLSAQDDLLLFSRLALAGTFLFTSDLVAICRRLAGDEGMLSGLERRDPVAFRGQLVYIYSELASQDMTPVARDRVMRSLTWAHLFVAEAQWNRDRLQAIRSLAKAAKTHPDKVRGLVKSLLPLVLGERGFRAARRTSANISRV